MPDTLTVIARFRAKPGMRHEVRDNLVAMIEPSLTEEGCLAYRPYLDATDPDRIRIHAARDATWHGPTDRSPDE